MAALKLFADAPRSPSSAARFSRSTAAALIVALAAPLLVACGSPVSSSDAMADGALSTDSANTDAPVALPDVPFATAPHNPLPQVPLLSGPTMAHVQLVIITYADDTNRTTLEAFGNWIGGSNWLHTVGADYGVGAGTVLGVVEKTENAPDAVTSSEIESMIAAGVMDGSLPSPSNHNYGDTLYMVFYPAHTTVTLQLGSSSPEQSCQSFGGYHSEVRQGALRVAYAVVPDCGGISGDTVAASHEYMEAATDPLPMSAPGYQLPTGGASSWGFIGGEVGDLCELSHTTTQDSGWDVQRIWSNTAAAASMDPCVPADTTHPFFNVSVDPTDVQYAAPGDTVIFNLTGWSVRPVADWQLSVMQQGGNVTMGAGVSTNRLNNGDSATMTVHVPRSAPPGYASFLVTSSTSRNRQVWPVVVLVN